MRSGSGGAQFSRPAASLHTANLEPCPGASRVPISRSSDDNDDNDDTDDTDDNNNNAVPLSCQFGPCQSVSRRWPRCLIWCTGTARAFLYIVSTLPFSPSIRPYPATRPSAGIQLFTPTKRPHPKKDHGRPLIQLSRTSLLSALRSSPSFVLTS